GPDMAPIVSPKGATPPSCSPGPTLGRAPVGSPRGRQPSRPQSTPVRASTSSRDASSPAHVLEDVQHRGVDLAVAGHDPGLVEIERLAHEGGDPAARLLDEE